MTAKDLVKYTKLSALELNTISADAGYPIGDAEADVDMQVVVRAVMSNVFIGCYPDKKLEILTYIRLVDTESLLTNGITAFVSALDKAQDGQEVELPPLMLSVTDSRYIGLMTDAGITFEAYDMTNGVFCPKRECRWPWMSMVLHIGTLMLRDRTFMSDYKNVALGTSQDGKPGLMKLEHPVQADTELD